MKNYYQILGLESNATIDEIKAAYKYLAKKFHPDMNPGDIKSKKYFQDIQEAYECLSDNNKRREYDNKYANWMSSDAANSGDTEANNVTKDRTKLRKAQVIYSVVSIILAIIAEALIYLHPNSMKEGQMFAPPVVVIIAYLYFLPVIYAYKKGHPYRKEIFILNIFSVFANLLTPLTFIVFYVCLLIYSFNKTKIINAIFMTIIGLFLAGMSAKHEREKNY